MYNINVCTLRTRACTGFDGGLEVGVAIRSAELRYHPQTLKLNAEDNLAYAA